MTYSVPNNPTHTVKFFNNWDGEGDIVWVLAYKIGDEFYCWDCGRDFGRPVIQYEGDQILGAWALNEENGSPSAVQQDDIDSAKSNESFTLHYSNMQPLVDCIVNEINAKHGGMFKRFVLTPEKLNEILIDAKLIAGDNIAKDR